MKCEICNKESPRTLKHKDKCYCYSCYIAEHKKEPDKELHLKYGLSFTFKDNGEILLQIKNNTAAFLNTQAVDQLYQFLQTNISHNRARKNTKCSTSTP